MAEEGEQTGQENQWSKEWPTEPGAYWFYGKRFGRDHTSEYHFVTFHTQGNGGLVAVCGNIFFYQTEQEGHGIWHKVHFPELPPEYQISESTGEEDDD